MIVIPGPASERLGARIVSSLEVGVGKLEHRTFPDGEDYIRIRAEVGGETAVLVQTTSPNPDVKLMQLLLMASTATDLGARRVIAVAPYLAYSRQDKRFKEGEALSLEVVLNLLESVGVDDLLVVDIHSERSLRRLESGKDLKVHNLSAIPLLADHLRGEGYQGAYSLSPDEGAVDLAKTAAGILKGDYDYFQKRRDRTTGDISMKVKRLDVEGKKAAVFDDIISSGGTMSRAVKALKEQSASKVAAVCTHALFMSNAEERIEQAGADLILASDTIETPYSKVTIAGLVADYLQSLE
ncbi:MAG: ribose-phosphate diphosphokinase [Candidatus Bathyarchaeia archaeon]